MLLIAFFTEEGTPKTGLSATIDVWEDDGTQVVTAQAMTEIAGGFYKYNFTAYDESKDYCIRADGSNVLAANDRYLFSTNEVGQITEDLTALDTLIDGVKERTDNLPSDPADDSDIDSQLAALDVLLDAIKAKTDNLPADPADDSDLDSQLAAINVLATAIKAKTDTISWTDITFLKDIEGGRWKIEGNQMIFYKSDNATEVCRFNLFDSAGVRASRNVYDRQRV
jgi:hypothetical protein